MRRWWMKQWDADGNTANLGEGELLTPADVARIIAAAPAMARALCLAEFSGYDPVRGCDVCPVCKSFGYDGSTSPPAPHDPDCGLHQSLTAAGLSPEDREAVRKAVR